jgi:transcription elongation factor Elf1
MPSSYPEEGELSGYRCPKCGSADVVCTLAVYDFSTLKCRNCGNQATVDDWQITKWFAPDQEE